MDNYMYMYSNGDKLKQGKLNNFFPVFKGVTVEKLQSYPCR